MFLSIFLMLQSIIVCWKTKKWTYCLHTLFGEEIDCQKHRTATSKHAILNFWKVSLLNCITSFLFTSWLTELYNVFFGKRYFFFPCLFGERENALVSKVEISLPMSHNSCNTRKCAMKILISDEGSEVFKDITYKTLKLSLVGSGKKSKNCPQNLKKWCLILKVSLT